VTLRLLERGFDFHEVGRRREVFGAGVADSNHRVADFSPDVLGGCLSWLLAMDVLVFDLEFRLGDAEQVCSQLLATHEVQGGPFVWHALEASQNGKVHVVEEVDTPAIRNVTRMQEALEKLGSKKDDKPEDDFAVFGLNSAQLGAEAFL